MLCELWIGEGSMGGPTFAPVESIKELLPKGLLGDNPHKIWEIEADSWEDALAEYHKYMEWEPYVPWDKRPWVPLDQK